MENLILGIGLLLFCSLIFWLSWRKYQKGQVGFTLLLILIGGLGLRSFVASDSYLHDWDERYHALVAKNMIDNPLKPMLYTNPIVEYDYTNWTENHVWLHKQPMALWAMALSMKVFGCSEFNLRLPSVLLSTLAIWLTFLIARFFFDDKVALISAFLHAIHGFTIEITGGRVTTDHIDLFFLFFIELGIYLSILSFKNFDKKRYPILVGIAIGLAILSKYLPALIVFGFWLTLCLFNGKREWKLLIQHSGLILLMAITVALPWQIYIFKMFPLEANYESDYNFLHLFEPLEGHEHPFYYYLDLIRIQFGELIYLPLIWFVWTFIKRPLSNWIPLLIWLFIPLIFFSLVQTKLPGYILFVSPVFFIITALFWRFLYLKQSMIKYKWLTKAILILLFLLPIRYSIERIKPFTKEKAPIVWKQKLEEIIEGENVVYFGLERPIETMFYKNVIAYQEVPSQTRMKELKQNGWQIFIKKEGEIIPFEIK